MDQSKQGNGASGKPTLTASELARKVVDAAREQARAAEDARRKAVQQDRKEFFGRVSEPVAS